MPDLSPQKTVLLIGASRGLGFAMVEEYLKRGWRVIATGREGSAEKLRQIAKTSHGALEVETIDIMISEQVAALRGRLRARRLDLLLSVLVSRTTIVKRSRMSRPRNLCA